MRPRNGKSHRDAELRESLEKIQLLEGSQQARVAGTAPTLPTTRPYPTGQTTGLTIGQPATALPAATNRGSWAATRDRYQQQAMPLLQTPVMTGVSTGVPSAAPPSGVASTHGAALPAMMVPNPSTPLGGFSGTISFANFSATPCRWSISREKSLLCPSSPSKVEMQPPSPGLFTNGCKRQPWQSTRGPYQRFNCGITP